MKKLHHTMQACSKYANLGYTVTLMAIAALMLSSCTDEGFDVITDNTTNLKASTWSGPGTPQMLTDGLFGSIGSTIGPDGNLYVAEGMLGQITRVDIETGEKTIFASGLPTWIIGIGGVMDLTFLDGKAYALVSVVGSQFGFTDIVGIYRIDGPTDHEVIADIGAFAGANSPTGFDYALEQGLQFAIQVFRGGFLVTDGHHNRVYYVTLDGTVSEFKTFGNIVPAGLEVRGKTIYMTETGPVPHDPETGKVVAFEPNSPDINELASGVPLLVDVEFNRGNTLFVLSQGEWEGAVEEAGMPGLPNTGSLARVNDDGTMTVVVDGLNLPTSLEFVGNKAFIVNLMGEVWTIDSVAGPPFGK